MKDVLQDIMLDTKLYWRWEKIEEESGLRIAIAIKKIDCFTCQERSALIRFMDTLLDNQIWKALQVGMFWAIGITTTEHKTGKETRSRWAIEKTDAHLIISKEPENQENER